MKLSTHPLTTTVIGGWPKPSWLSTSRHDLSGWTIDRDWQFHGAELNEKQDEATEWALREQEATGVDILSDGEERRENYGYYYCRHLDGFDFGDRRLTSGRSGTWEWLMPRITGPVVSQTSLLSADYRFIRERTDRMVKMTIPGPMTIIDSAKNEHYRDEVALAIDLAAAIRVEVQSLASAGCEIIQFDEPAFVRYLQKLFDYGLRALEACFEGVHEITTVVHICCGFPIEGYAKTNVDAYTLIAPVLADSTIDQVSIEGAHSPLDLNVLRQFGDKDIIFGLVDVGEPRVETVEEVETEIRRVLQFVEPDRLFPGPDCGMIYLKPKVARAKLTNLVEATRRVRKSQ